MNRNAAKFIALLATCWSMPMWASVQNSDRSATLDQVLLSGEAPFENFVQHVSDEELAVEIKTAPRVAHRKIAAIESLIENRYFFQPVALNELLSADSATVEELYVQHAVAAPVPITAEERELLAEEDSPVVDAGQVKSDSVQDTERMQHPASGLHIGLKGGRLTVVPNFLELGERDRELPLTTGFEEASEERLEIGRHLQVFVRDDQVVDWDARTQKISTVRPGYTEIYVVGFDQMKIVPVQVMGSIPSEPNKPPRADSKLIVRKAPDEPVAPIEPSPRVVAQNQPKPFAIAQDLTTVTVRLPDQAGGSIQVSASKRADLATPTLDEQQARAAAAATAKSAEARRKSFQVESQEVGYANVTLQFIDDRSSPEQGQIYPVSGLEVEIVGTEFRAVSDHSGMVKIRDLPLRSRFLVDFQDTFGRVHNGVAEIDTGSQSDAGVIQIRTLRELIFETYHEIASAELSQATGTVCGEVVHAVDGTMAENLKVAIDVGAEGPYYTNRFGLEPSLDATTEYGRFCFFNVEPGPAVINIFDGDRWLSHGTVSIFPNRHIEQELTLGSQVNIRTRIASLPSATQVLMGYTPGLLPEYKLVDMVELIPLDGDEGLTSLSFGLVGDTMPYALGDRVSAVTMASEFESVLYTYRGDGVRGDPVTPLFPRGFLEDMSVSADIYQDAVLGAVIAEHGRLAGQPESRVQFELYDHRGRSVGQRWRRDQNPLDSLDFFFNLRPGTYSLLTKTEDGYWLAADTVLVFNETVSYVRTGSPLSYRDMTHH